MRYKYDGRIHPRKRRFSQIRNSLLIAVSCKTRNSSVSCTTHILVVYHVRFYELQVVELKKAESLKETERREKKISKVQELKVGNKFPRSHKWSLIVVFDFNVNSSFPWQKKIRTMTANEYFEKHPELKKISDNGIWNDVHGNWESMHFLATTFHFKSWRYSRSFIKFSCLIRKATKLFSSKSGAHSVWGFCVFQQPRQKFVSNRCKIALCSNKLWIWECF